MRLYQDVAKSTARSLGYQYDEKLNEKMSQFIEDLRSGSQ
jgi:hypothetical protein